MKFLLVSFLLVVSFLFQGITAQAAVLTDGMLVRAQESGTIFLIDGSTKRQIASPEAFRGQGFKGDAVTTVPLAELAAYPTGEIIRADSKVILPRERGALPDLAPYAPYDFHFSVSAGRQVLRFTADLWNQGASAFEMRSRLSEPTGKPDHYAAYQRLILDGSSRERRIGELFFHDTHNHIHYENFGTYSIELVTPLEAPKAPTAPGVKKTTFCMRDDFVSKGKAVGGRQPRSYGGCTQSVQGISVGWVDSYPYTLPDQFVDIENTVRGIYKISFLVDPLEHFVELRKDNNIGSTFIEMNPAARTARVLARFSPFVNPQDTYRDGILVKSKNDPKVYAIYQGKKRAIPTAEIFAAYGYNWNDVWEISRAELDAIPQTRIIRIKDRNEIYTLSPQGYIRRILNPEVFTSYRFNRSEAAVISEAEFAQYPQTPLIVKTGTDRVFSTDSKSYIGRLSEIEALGYNRQSVHVVNATDFNSYAVQVVAQGLDVPWDIAFLSGGDMLVTERGGTIRRLGSNPATLTVPSVSEVGEGGLMGLVLHPNFAQNSFIYLYFTTQGSVPTNRIVRFRLEGNRLTQDKVILDNIPASLYHDGGRMIFGADGMLYVTTGDASKPELAQNLSSLAGKTLRLTPEGGIPPGNPFGTAVWSYGHRNSQGIVFDAQGRLWETEHGRSGASSGFDELNLIERGGNYGWPTIQGSEARAGLRAPIKHSGATSTWAPAGLAFVDGSFFFAGLLGSTLYEARLNQAGEVASMHTHLRHAYGRLRAVTLGPDGFLYVTTSNRDGRGTPQSGDDKILKINPAFLR